MTIASIDVRDLLGNPGAHRREALRGTLEDLGTEVAWVPSDQLIVGDLLLESIIEGVLVSARLSGTFQMQCARCLKEFEKPFEVEVHELFVSEPADDTDDYPLEAEGFIEVEQMVRDAVGVELPFSPLCTPDCLGLCPVCGGDRNLGECPGDHVEVDPRWSGLEQLFHGSDMS
ncbi:MAG: YceD family protein [Actinomycetota bacterium]|nr:YceD family protein [Actinomycetota bacterium]